MLSDPKLSAHLVRAWPGKALAVSKRRRARGLHLPSEPSTALGRAFTRGTKGYSVTLKIYYPKPPGLCSDRSRLGSLVQKRPFYCLFSLWGLFLGKGPPFGLELVLGQFSGSGAPGREGTPKALKGQNFGSKGLPARIWPKRAVSYWSQKGILIAGHRPSNCRHLLLKGSRQGFG